MSIQESGRIIRISFQPEDSHAYGVTELPLQTAHGINNCGSDFEGNTFAFDGVPPETAAIELGINPSAIDPTQLRAVVEFAKTYGPQWVARNYPGAVLKKP